MATRTFLVCTSRIGDLADTYAFRIPSWAQKADREKMIQEYSDTTAIWPDGTRVHYWILPLAAPDCEATARLAPVPKESWRHHSVVVGS